MFSYYLKLGWLSIQRNPLLSILMIAAIAVGIGASMTTITVNYIMSGNPIPHKSDQLFYVQIDNWDPNEQGDEGYELQDQITYIDAMALMKASKAHRQIASNRSHVVLEPQGDDEMPFSIGTRNTWSDFFSRSEASFMLMRDTGMLWLFLAWFTMNPATAFSLCISEPIKYIRDAF